MILTGGETLGIRYMHEKFLCLGGGGGVLGCFLGGFRGRGLLELEDKKKNNGSESMNEIVF